MKITKDVLNKGMSSRNGWSHKQLGLLGVDIPLLSGWYWRLIGSEVESEKVEEFWSLKDWHLRGKRGKRAKIEKCPTCGQVLRC